ncbi:MAG TPA: hypothetical protein PKC28_03990 [Bdellovibrionales bacterium]|nr:hypothetical protein [Bdellovibrionales bacterium]
MARWLLIIFLSLTALACARQAPEDGASSVVIQAPAPSNALNKFGGVGSMAALPSDRKACYAVVVSGEGIASPSLGTCSAVNGVFAGFVEPGAQLEISAPRGTRRKIELLAYLQDPGQNVACPEFKGSMTPEQMLRTYSVGAAMNVDLLAATVTVEIMTSFPGVANHIASQLRLPASCSTPTLPGDQVGGRAGFHFSSGAGVAGGGGYRVKARFSGLPGTKTLTGPGYRLIVK